MKKSDRLKKEADATLSKIRAIARHIRNVNDNCLLLGEYLISNGEMDLGRQLIANGCVHDASKFHGIEFEFMAPGVPIQEDVAKLKLKLAVHHHNCTNSHHPEYWGNIKNMPKVALAECICDWKSRSEEFGTSLKNWIDEDATKRFGFTKEDEIYKQIMYFVNILCPTPFEQIK